MARVSRRNFMAATAGAAATMAATRSHAGANDTIRVAVVGVRGRGGSHISGLGSQKNVEIVALCDTDSRVFGKRLKEFEEKGWKKLRGERKLF